MYAPRSATLGVESLVSEKIRWKAVVVDPSKICDFAESKVGL